MNYDQEVLKTLSHEFHISETHIDNAEQVTPELLHAAIGIASEAGELLDAIKKALFYGNELDIENIIEELGDLEYYMAVARRFMFVTQNYVQEENIRKLRTRYGEEFSPDKAEQRKDKQLPLFNEPKYPHDPEKFWYPFIELVTDIETYTQDIIERFDVRINYIDMTEEEFNDMNNIALDQLWHQIDLNLPSIYFTKTKKILTEKTDDVILYILIPEINENKTDITAHTTVIMRIRE